MLKVPPIKLEYIKKVTPLYIARVRPAEITRQLGFQNRRRIYELIAYMERYARVYKIWPCEY